jgi:hypothetical protein
MKNVYLLLFLLLVAVGLGSCGEDEVVNGDGTLTHLTVSPSSATVEVGGTQVFSVTAYYDSGSTSNPFASWSVTGGIGSVQSIGLNALFTATTTGEGTVAASYGGKSDSAAVTVTGEVVPTHEATLSTIEVTPSDWSMRVGESQIFTASGVDTSGESMAIKPTWTVSSDAIGVITADGTTATLEANAEGSALILAVSGEVTGMAYVTVEGFTVEITVETDTYVDEANTGEAHGSDTSLKAGYVHATDRHYEAYFKFLLSSIPGGASIESVTFLVFPSASTDSALQIKKLDSAFDNITTWTTRPSLGAFVVSGVYTAGDYNNVSDDNLTDLVREWQSTPANNYGLALVQEGTDDGIVVILSKEDGSDPPLLKVEYTIP